LFVHGRLLTILIIHDNEFLTNEKGMLAKNHLSKNRSILAECKDFFQSLAHLGDKTNTFL